MYQIQDDIAFALWVTSVPSTTSLTALVFTPESASAKSALINVILSEVVEPSGGCGLLIIGGVVSGPVTVIVLLASLLV